MSDTPIWTRDEPQSPCVNICVVHPTSGLCTGCLRTLDEIATWSTLSAPERQMILDALPGRKSKLRVRRGGRAGRAKKTDQ